MPVAQLGDAIAQADNETHALGKLDLEELGKVVAECRKCNLCEKRTNAVFGKGTLATGGLLLVGEGPGEQEDLQGLPFVGRAGKLLDSMLATIGINDGKGIYITNVVKCRPPGNRNPSATEIATCLPYLLQQLKLLQPSLIVTLGKVAGNALLGTTASMRDMRGQLHEFQGLPLVAHYHPAYLLRTPTAKRQAWADLVRLRSLLDENKQA